MLTQEARATRAAVKKQCMRSAAPEILLNGTDSRVCLGAFAKGRVEYPEQEETPPVLVGFSGKPVG